MGIELQSESADFGAFDAIYAWPGIMAEARESPALPAPYSDALVGEEMPAPVGYVLGTLLFLALLAGNWLFDWFIPTCGGDGALALGAAALAARLMFSQPLLAFALAFGIGDPVVDTVGHCLMAGL